MNRDSIWKNSLFISFSQGIRLFTNFFIVAGIARLYGPEVFGQFTVAFSLSNIFLAVVDFGFDVSLTTAIAANRENAKLISQKYFSIKIALAVLSSLFMIAVVGVMDFSTQSKTLMYLLVFYVVFTSITNFFFALFRGLEKFEIETKISFVSNLVLLVSIAVLGLNKVAIVYLIFSFIAARILGVYLSFHQSGKIIGRKFLILNFDGWQDIIKPIIVFGIHFLFGNIYFIVDTILIGLILGDHSAGIYRASFTIMLLILVIPDVIRNAALPLASRLFHEHKENWENLNKTLIKIVLFLGLSSFLISFYWATEILHFIYSKENYNDSIPILKMFSFVMVVRFLQDILSLMIATSKRQTILMVISVLATILSIGLNYFMISNYGIWGASLVCLIVNSFVLFGYIYFNKDYFFKWLIDLRIVFVILLNLVFASFVTYLPKSIFLIPMVFVFSLIISLIVGFSKNEKNILTNSLLRNSRWKL